MGQNAFTAESFGRKPERLSLFYLENISQQIHADGAAPLPDLGTGYGFVSLSNLRRLRFAL
jgi:hypothetical protein